MEIKQNKSEEEVMENFPYLPQELVEKILVRLPCKSLMRFKCVCKHWCALCHKDTKFLSRHVSHFLKNQNSAANDVLLMTVASKLFSLSATGIGMEFPIPPFNSHSKYFQICGHSNGIVCLSTINDDDDDDHEEVLLYNPATREFRHLPEAAKPLGSWSLPVAVGMGYDSSINDFKVIRIWERCRMTWAEQYTLNTNSWTLMPNSNSELFDFDSDSFALCFNRTFYWWASYFECNSDVIVALNMDDDGVFQIVPKPPRAHIGHPHDRSLTVWNDSISLVCCNYDFDVDIWVMDGFGSWTHMRTIENLGEEVPKPLVFWKGNKLLMEMVSCGEIKSYNVDTQEIEDVLQTDELISDFQAVNYVASLVPLKGEYL